MAMRGAAGPTGRAGTAGSAPRRPAPRQPAPPAGAAAGACGPRSSASSLSRKDSIGATEYSRGVSDPTAGPHETSLCSGNAAVIHRLFTNCGKSARRPRDCRKMRRLWIGGFHDACMRTARTSCPVLTRWPLPRLGA